MSLDATTALVLLFIYDGTCVHSELASLVGLEPSKLLAHLHAKKLILLDSRDVPVSDRVYTLTPEGRAAVLADRG